MTPLLDLLDFSRAGSATVWGPDRKLITVGPDVLRQAYDPVTGKWLGALVETGATNLLQYSEAFDNAGWTKSNLTVTANAETAPDGESTMDLLIPSTDSTDHFAAQTNISVTTGATVTLSMWAKAGGYNIVRLRIRDQAANNSVIVDFDLAAGTKGSTIIAGTATAGTATIEAYPDGLYRCSVTCTVATATAYQGFGYALQTAGVSIFAGDGSSGVHVWGAQLEVGSTATSYIKTEGSTVTRAGDVLTLSRDDWEWPQTGMTVAMDCMFPVLPAADYPDLVRLYESANTSNLISVFYAGGTGTLGLRSRPNGVSEGAIDVTPDPAIAAGTAFGVAARVAVDDFGLSVNGAAPGTDTSGGIPAPDTLRLGLNTPAILIRKLILAPYPAGPAQLAELSKVAS